MFLEQQDNTMAALLKLEEERQQTGLELVDAWGPLSDNGGKHMEMHLPIIMKNLSREKLTTIAEILTTLANHCMIV